MPPKIAFFDTFHETFKFQKIVSSHPLGRSGPQGYQKLRNKFNFLLKIILFCLIIVYYLKTIDENLKCCFGGVETKELTSENICF